MHLFAFILIGGIWAAFLLPSLVDGRRTAPTSSTRSFARSKHLLASVATSDAHQLMYRRRASLRRRRILAGLGFAAFASLVMAILQASTIWLAGTIVLDLAVAGYVTLLLQAQQGAPARAEVLPLPVAEDPQPSTVRVVAG